MLRDGNMSKKVAFLMTFLIALSGCLGNGSNKDDYDFNGMEYNPASNAPDFVLYSQDGQVISLSDFDGKVVVIAFTYTHCPDVCLAIEANLKTVHNELGEEEDLVILSITIDPARDTPENLLEWTEARGYTWPHLTSDNSSDFTNDNRTGVWDNYNLLVDNDHINSDHSNHDEHQNHSVMLHQVAVLYPDSTTALLDGHHDMLPEENPTGWNLTTSTMMMNNISINSTAYECCGNMLTGIDNYVTPSDSSWWWNLYYWNETNSSWDYDPDKGADDIIVMQDTDHIAWVASNANITYLPTPDSNMVCYNMDTHALTEDSQQIACESYSYFENYTMNDGQDICYNMASHSVSNDNETNCESYMYLENHTMQDGSSFTGCYNSGTHIPNSNMSQSECDAFNYYINYGATVFTGCYNMHTHTMLIENENYCNSHMWVQNQAPPGTDDSQSSVGMDNHHGEHGMNIGDDEVYEVGHNTVTFIIDKNGHKRIVYTGSDWDTSDFIEDLEYLLEEETEVWYDCMTDEVWSDEKQAWCDEYSNHDEHEH